MRTAEQQQLTLAARRGGGAASQRAVADMQAPGAASREAATRSSKARADRRRLGAGAHSGGGRLTRVGRPAAVAARASGSESGALRDAARLVERCGSTGPWWPAVLLGSGGAEQRSRGPRRAAGAACRRSTRPSATLVLSYGLCSADLTMGRWRWLVRNSQLRIGKIIVLIAISILWNL